MSSGRPGGWMLLTAAGMEKTTAWTRGRGLPEEFGAADRGERAAGPGGGLMSGGAGPLMTGSGPRRRSGPPKLRRAEARRGETPAGGARSWPEASREAAAAATAAWAPAPLRRPVSAIRRSRPGSEGAVPRGAGGLGAPDYSPEAIACSSSSAGRGPRTPMRGGSSPPPAPVFPEAVPVPSTLARDAWRTVLRPSVQGLHHHHYHERLSDPGNSSLSMRSLSSGSRASGDSQTDVTGDVRLSPLAGATPLTIPRLMKQGSVLLPSVGIKPQANSRRFSEPGAVSAPPLSPPALPSPERPATTPRRPARPRRTATKQQVAARHGARATDRDPARPRGAGAPQGTASTGQPGPRRRVQLGKASDDREDGAEEDEVEEEGEEEEEEVGDGDGDAERNSDCDELELKVRAWLQGLDSATCRRFMRRQMATVALQGPTDH